MGDGGPYGGHFNPYPSANYAGYSAPQPGSESPEAIIDREHLRLLRIGYFISAGQTALFVPFGLLYAVLGLTFSHLSSTPSSPPPPAEVSWIISAFGGFVALVAGLATLLKLLTAVRLKERRSRVLCLISAALALMEIPYGTALGIMTFVVLGRRDVREQFDRPH